MVQPSAIGSTDKSVTGLGQCVVVLKAERHAEDVGRVGLKDDGLAFAIEFHPARKLAFTES